MREKESERERKRKSKKMKEEDREYDSANSFHSVTQTHNTLYWMAFLIDILDILELYWMSFENSSGIDHLLQGYKCTGHVILESLTRGSKSV